MRKIPYIYDNPLDNLFYELSEITSPYAYSIGFTPNMITTLSNIACIITILLLLNANYYWAALFVLIAFYFDCMDGYMARKYKMYSSFGDYYDHISDYIKTISILVVLYYIDSNKFYNIIPILVLLVIMLEFHMGCQELLSDGDNVSDTLESTKKFCPVKNNNDINEIKNAISSTKLFGPGTFQIALALSIVYYDY